MLIMLLTLNLNTNAKYYLDPISIYNLFFSSKCVQIYSPLRCEIAQKLILFLFRSFEPEFQMPIISLVLFEIEYCRPQASGTEQNGSSF